MGKIISIANHKGGVGKTTTCVNLAAGLGILEKKVLVIDTDSQANATTSFGFQSKNYKNPALKFMSIISVLKNNRVTTNSPNVDLIPYLEDVDFFKEVSDSYSFKEALNVISNLYDYIIIDCVPFFKKNNLKILKISHSIIIPVQCDYYALEGLHKFLRTVTYVQKNMNPTLAIEGFLLTMFDSRVNLSRKVVQYIQSYFKTMVFKTIINRNTKISQAPGFGKSIFEHDVTSLGAKDYLALANEIIKNNKDLKVYSDIPSLPEEQEIVFNKKTLSKKILVNNKDTIEENSYLKKLAQKEEQVKEKTFPKNFTSFLGLDKSEVKQKIGLRDNDFNTNIWFYKYNNSNNFLSKKYLYLYFKNNFVKNYEVKRFKITTK